MKLLIIHQAFVGPSQAGGTRHFEFAKALITLGHQPTIVASDLSYLSGMRVTQGRRLITEEDIEGIRVLRAYTYPVLHKSFAWRVICFLSFALTSVWAALRSGPVDVVMGTTPPIFQAVSAWLVSVLRWRPFLLEVRDLWPEFAVGMGVLKNPALIILARWLERFLYRRASHILVNSPAYRDYLIRREVLAEKISLIPNGADCSMFNPDCRGEGMRRELALDGRFVVTYAGALGLANDIGTVLDAADRLRGEPDLQILLVGDGKERKNLERKAQERGLSNVTFVGARPKSEMPEVLAASDACLAILQDIPEFRTTYPNKVFDYMAAGRPTILAIDGVIRQVIEDSGGGIFVRPGDGAALAEAIRTVKADPGRAAAMGRAARQYVAAHFDRASHAQTFAELLVRLTGRA